MESFLSPFIEEIMNKWSLAIVHSVIHITMWIVSILVINFIMAHSDARLAYGIISGWWLSLYVGYIIRIELRTAYLVGAFYIVCGVLAVLFGWQWFYSDIPTTITVLFMFRLVSGALLFASPIILNIIVIRFRGT